MSGVLRVHIDRVLIDGTDAGAAAFSSTASALAPDVVAA